MAHLRRRIGLSILALAAGLGAASAQEVQPRPAPPGSLEALPERIEPDPNGEDTLSEELEESRGVIKPPPGVDPGIVERPPEPSRFPTPVIPPALPPAPPPQ
jgi:hypothetical protein